MNEVESKVLDRISPGPEMKKKVNKVLQDVLSSIVAAIEDVDEDLGYDIEPLVVGSVAKDTYDNEPDIDIFLMFPPRVELEEMKRLGLEIGHSVLKNGKEKYAQHPYVTGRYRGFEVDLVPSYGIKDMTQRKTAVDRTPFHTEFIKEHLEEGQRDDVRLLKRFMKGIGVYGAEASVQGFSGYLCELLVLRYGSFRSMLEAVSKWKKGVSLSLGDKAKKFREPLAFIDPTDTERNVASAVSLPALARFIAAAKDYLRNPDERFFFPRPVETMTLTEIKAELQSLGLELAIMAIPLPDVLEDSLSAQMRKTLDSLEKVSSGEGYGVYLGDYGYDPEIGRGWFLMVYALPSPRYRKLHRGPRVWDDNVPDFKRKWNEGGKKPFVKGERWCVFAPLPSDIRQAIEKNRAGLSVGKDLVMYFDDGEVEFLDLEGIEGLEYGEKLLGDVTALISLKQPWEW